MAKGEPVISIDTKKKELIGNFSRDDHTYTQTPVDALDHNFPNAGEGKLIPHGIGAKRRAYKPEYQPRYQ